MPGSAATLGIARLLGVPPPESLLPSVELTRSESSPEEIATKAAETRERLLRAAARRTARDEARSLLSLIRPGTGETVRTVRELIEVTAAQEDALLDRILAHPEESTGILRALHFREMVLEEFNRLVSQAEHAERSTAMKLVEQRIGVPKIVPMVALDASRCLSTERETIKAKSVFCAVKTPPRLPSSGAGLPW